MLLSGVKRGAGAPRSVCGPPWLLVLDRPPRAALDGARIGARVLSGFLHGEPVVVAAGEVGVVDAAQFEAGDGVDRAVEVLGGGDRSWPLEIGNGRASQWAEATHARFAAIGRRSRRCSPSGWAGHQDRCASHVVVVLGIVAPGRLAARL